MDKSATIIPFPFQAFGPVGDRAEVSALLGRQRTLSDAISAIQVHRDLLDGLRLPLLALREGWEVGKPLRTLLHLLDHGPAAHGETVLGKGFQGKANPLPDPDSGTGDLLILGGDIAPEDLQVAPELSGAMPSLSFPFSGPEAYIKALDGILQPEGIRVVPASSARLPLSWRGLRREPLVPLFVSPGSLAPLPRYEALPGWVENGPRLTLGVRQWPSLGRYAPEALPILSAEAFLRLELLDAELSQRLRGLAETAEAESGPPPVHASPEACAQTLALALRASAARAGTVGHAPLSPEIAKTLTTDH